MKTKETANEQPFLSINDVAFLHKFGLYRAIARRAADIKGIVLDYGCGRRPYEPLFVNCAHYLGADIQGNPLEDVAYQIGSPLPLKDQSVDAILSTQVLQSVRDPEQYLGECRRILRPEGRLLLSSPGFWCYMGSSAKNGSSNEATDCRRWTHEGLKYEVERAGFKVIDLDKICIFRAFLCQFMNLMIVSRFLSKTYTRPLGRLLLTLVNRIGNWYPDEVVSYSALDQTHLAITYLIIAVPRVAES